MLRPKRRRISATIVSKLIGLCRRAKSWFALQRDKTHFLLEGAACLEASSRELREIQQILQTLGIGAISDSLPDQIHKYDLQYHPAIPFMIKSRARVRNETSVRIISREDQFGKKGYAFDTDAYADPVIINGKDLGDAAADGFYFLDRVRKPLETSIPSRERARNAARRFATVFQEDEGDEKEAFCRTTGLLPCWGLAEIYNERMRIYSWEAILRLPRNMDSQPRTLRRMLDDYRIRSEVPALTDRLRFAIRLAESILVLHGMATVHKSINPDNVLVIKLDDIEDNRYPRTIGMPYLIGFDQVRGEDQESGYTSFYTNTLKKEIYVHPNLITTQYRLRQYHMLDDIYSFGVMLIEIVLWKSFFKYDTGSGSWQNDCDVLPLHDEHYIKKGMKQKDVYEQRRKDLLDKVNDVRIISGPKLASLIEYCLECREHKNPGEGTKRLEILRESRGEICHEDFAPSKEASSAMQFAIVVLSQLQVYVDSL